MSSLNVESAPASSRRRRRPIFSCVILILAGIGLIWLAVPSIGPAVRAATADGTPGVFTAQRLDCVEHPGHEACTWYGDFRASDGSVRMSDIALYGADRGMLHEGQQTQAFDVGRPTRVYGPGGSNEWVMIALLLVAGAAGVVIGLVRVARAPR
ncbi:hypothetical protein J5X84_31400 [Streptosporangiaceae bacterium NEAU-GS5]|nr:hypothetical protein [Streptosporangiaceae bacterium NEAU-GS5]